MVTQEQVNRWCEVAKLRSDATLDSVFWRFSVELERRQVTKAYLMELFETWYYGPSTSSGTDPVAVLPVVVEEMT